MSLPTEAIYHVIGILSIFVKNDQQIKGTVC